MIPLRLALGGAAALVLILVIGIVLYNFDPFGRRKNAEQRAENATAQAATSEVVAKAADTHHTETIVIRERADRAIQTVDRAPGADDPIDLDRRATLCAALASVRNSVVCETDGDDPGNSESPVQGSEDAP
jgi:hypothetical protein